MMVAGLNVAGKFYPGERWREALLAFLFGLWGEDPFVMSTPEITFVDMFNEQLQFRRFEVPVPISGVIVSPKIVKKYYIYGDHFDASLAQTPTPKDERNSLVVDGDNELAVLDGFVRFVKCDRFLQLEIVLRDSRSIILRKDRNVRGTIDLETTGYIPPPDMKVALNVIV